MIKVFNANERVFTSNGEKILKPLKAVILKEDNGDYMLTLETTIADNDYIQEDNIIVCNTPWGEQGFRVYNPQKKNNRITCECKHLYFDGDHYLIEDAYAVDKTCNDALDHFNMATDTASPFTTLSNIATVESLRIVRKSLTQAISEVIDRWGGHLVRDNFNIKVMASIGTDNGVTLRYGKNISDISAKEDWSKVVTKLLPVGKDGLTIGYVSTADLPDNDEHRGLTYAKPYTKTVTFTQDISDEDEDGNKIDEEVYAQMLVDDLRSQAVEYVKQNCIPQITYTVKADIQKVTDVGDTIEVYHEKLGLNLLTNVISLKYDCIAGRFTEINFGNFSNKLKNLISNVSNSAKTDIKNTVNNEVVPQVETKLNEAYDKIWNALGSSYVIYEGDKILVVDALPKDTAKNCIMINSAGVSFSQNGINGAFTSAWLIDGTLNMQAINVVNLVADMIKGGTLKLGSETQGHGKLEIYDEANKRVGSVTKDGITMWSKDGGYIKINNEVGFAGFDKNNNKIYWADGEVFHTKKFVAGEEITIGNVRMLPMISNTNAGIGFVAVVK